MRREQAFGLEPGFGRPAPVSDLTVAVRKGEGQEALVFAATVSPQGVLVPDAPNATAGKLSKWKGRHVTVTASRYIKPKSQPQLGKYFADVVPAWAEFCGYDPSEAHKELKKAFLKPQLEVALLTGEEIKTLPSLRDLDVEQMSTYLERCIREGQQLGIQFGRSETAIFPVENE